MGINVCNTSSQNPLFITLPANSQVVAAEYNYFFELHWLQRELQAIDLLVVCPLPQVKRLLSLVLLLN